jgi:hypothetical protein
LPGGNQVNTVFFKGKTCILKVMAKNGFGTGNPFQKGLGSIRAYKVLFITPLDTREDFFLTYP